MAPTTETTNVAEEHDVHRQDELGPSPTADSESGQIGGLAGFSAAFGESPTGGAKLLSHRALSLSSNSNVRSVAFRQAQRAYGNHFVQRALSGAIQRKTVTNQPVQRECACGGTCTACLASRSSSLTNISDSSTLIDQPIQAKADGSKSSDPRSGNGNLIPTGGGEPLNERSRSSMESRFGRDFSDVHIHTDEKASASAEALNANAYTTGRDIYFAAGKYAPENDEGKRLLAHELVHTMQQANTPSLARQSTSNSNLIIDPDDSLEQDADRVADQIVSSAPVGVVGQNSSRVVVHTDSKSAKSPLAMLSKRGSGVIGSAFRPQFQEARDSIAHESAPVVQRTATASVQRQTGASEDRIALLKTHLAADREVEAISTIASLTPDEVARVLADAGLMELAVDALDDKEMGKAVLAMHGDAVPSLRWLLAEECEWAQIGAFLKSNPPHLEAVLLDTAMMHGFVDALNDTEMADALLLLPGSLIIKMLWLMAQRAGYDEAVKVIKAAPEDERLTLYGRNYLRDWFVEICDDATMWNLVLFTLKGTLRQQLEWMKAEDTSWPMLRTVLASAPQDQRTALLGDADMRTFFQETLNDDEMKWALEMLGGPLSQRIEWLQAEDVTEAPADVERPPSLSEPDVQLLNRLEGRSQLMLRLQALEKARTKSSRYAAVAGARSTEAFQSDEGKEAQTAFLAELHAQGFSDLEGFLEEIRRFEALFLAFGLQTAFAMLADNRRIALQERDRYAGNEGEVLLRHLTWKLYGNIYAQVAIATTWTGVTPLASDAATYPILAHPNFYTPDMIKIINEGNAAELATHIRDVADGVIENIGKTRKGLLDDTDKLWQLERVIAPAKQMMGIVDGSVFDLLIKRKIAQIARDEAFKSLAWAALAIGLGLLSGGTGAIAVLAGAGALTISAISAVQSWKRYSFTSAAHGSSIDPARALTQVDPSALWLAVDVIGAFLDLGGFATAINRLRKASEAVLKSGEAAARSARLTELRQEAHEVTSDLHLRPGQDIVSEEAFVDSVVLSANRRAEQQATLASDPELTKLVKSRAAALETDDAAVAGLVALGENTAKAALQAFGDNPELLRRLATLAESEPAMAKAISRLHGGLGDEAFANIFGDVLLRRDPGRADALVSAMAGDRLGAEQVQRLAEAGRKSDPATRTRAIAEELDRTLTEATGRAPHGSPAQTQALERTRTLEEVKNPAKELVDEWDYVQGSRPIPIDDVEYVAEVVLPNGHKWRQNRVGRWCRFTSAFCLTDGAITELVGRVTRAERALKSVAPLDWPVYRIDPAQPPDIVPAGVVLEFPTGERVWRQPGEGGGIVIESQLGPASRRQRFEAAYFSRGEMELDPYAKSTMERAHSQGQGTGFESPYSIPYAPFEVNQVLQNAGIEEFLRTMARAQPEGATYHLVTNTKMHPNSRRLSQIEYVVDIEYQGVRKPGFQVAIRVSDDIKKPRVWIEDSLTYVNNDLDVLEILFAHDVLPHDIRSRMAAMFRRRRRPPGG